MARRVQAEEYATRLNEILDAAQALVLSKGYERLTIQDVLDTLKISKGAFYHYFGSKQALIEALVARMVAQIMDMLRPIVQDQGMPALPKLEAVFGAVAGWKSARRDLMAALLRVWYADENAPLRERLTRTALAEFGLVLQPVIAQGMAEGVMQTDYPELAGTIALSLLQNMGLELAHLLLHWEETPAALVAVERLVAAYTQAIERVLGVTAGALRLIDPALFIDWGETFTGITVAGG